MTKWTMVKLAEMILEEIKSREPGNKRSILMILLDNLIYELKNL